MTAPRTSTIAYHQSASAAPPTGSMPPQSLTINPSKLTFAGSLAQYALAWHQPAWTETQIAQDVTRVAVTVIPAAHGAAIVALAGPGELTTIAAHGVLPDLRAPARAAAGRADTLADLPSANGWPVFTAPSGPGWVGSTICIPLGSGRTMFGTLIVAADHHGSFTTAMLTVLATHASIALGAARDRTNLQAALASRDLIGQAKGILMERGRITADTAFTELVRLSQSNNMKLRELCDQLTATGEIPDPPATTGRASHR